LRSASPLQVEVSLRVSEPEYLPPPPPKVVIDQTLIPREEVWVRAPIPGVRVQTSRTTRLAGEERVDDLGESLHEPRPGVVRRRPRPGRFQ
jgi:hypothetical protein